MRRILTLILPLFLFACGGNTPTPVEALTPLPASVKEPSNEALASAISQWIVKTEGPLSTGYDFVRYDLNGDRRRDAIVLFKSPYGFWCDDHGCPMLIFRAHDKHFTHISTSKPIRGPLYISTLKTNGWNDLVTRVSGRWSASKDVALKFDGRSYPQNPEKLRPFPRKNYNGYTKIFYR